MSTRTAYQRSGEFGATRTALKAGKKYEAKVYSALCDLLNKTVRLNPDPYNRPQFRLLPQFPRNGGLVDFCLRRLLPAEDSQLFLIEVKSQWSADAALQLLRYAGSELSSVSRVCICKTYHPHIKLPEPVLCSPLDDLLLAPRGQLTIIPWARRKCL